MEALRRYYDQLFRFRQFSEPLGLQGLPAIGERVSLWKSSDLDLEFGILPELEEALQEGSADRALAVLNRLPSSMEIRQNPHLGSDGIVVIPGDGWQESVN
jgi:hypothetical protein